VPPVILSVLAKPENKKENEKHQVRKEKAASSCEEHDGVENKAPRREVVGCLEMFGDDDDGNRSRPQEAAG